MVVGFDTRTGQEVEVCVETCRLEDTRVGVPHWGGVACLVLGQPGCGLGWGALECCWLAEGLGVWVLGSLALVTEAKLVKFG